MLFTEGKHQQYERMMRQTPRNHPRSRKEKKELGNKTYCSAGSSEPSQGALFLWKSMNV